MKEVDIEENFGDFLNLLKEIKVSENKNDFNTIRSKIGTVNNYLETIISKSFSKLGELNFNKQILERFNKGINDFYDKFFSYFKLNYHKIFDYLFNEKLLPQTYRRKILPEGQ